MKLDKMKLDKMKVLWFTNTPSGLTEVLTGKKVTGGGWINSLEVALKVKPDIDLHIAFKYGFGINYEQINGNDTVYWRIPIASSKNKLAKRLNRLNHLAIYKSLIDEVKPDIIQVFGTEYDYGLIADLTKIPVVIHIQGILTVYDYKYFSGFNPFYFMPHYLTLLCREMKNKKNMLRNAARERQIYGMNRFFMGRTLWDQRITSILSKDAKYFLCNEMLRDSFYSQRKLQYQPHEEFKLFTTIWGGLYKGLEIIFYAAKILKEHTKFKWQLAGITCDDPLLKVLEKRFDTTVSDLNIVCLGPQNEIELVDKLIKSDLFVHTSHIDNSPNSICEAMITGVPVVATFSGGIPSMVENGVTGVLVQDGDPWALAAAVLEVKTDYKKHTEYAQNAVKIAEVKHNKAQIVNNLCAIYGEIISDYNSNKK